MICPWAWVGRYWVVWIVRSWVVWNWSWSWCWCCGSWSWSRGRGWGWSWWWCVHIHWWCIHGIRSWNCFNNGWGLFYSRHNVWGDTRCWMKGHSGDSDYRGWRWGWWWVRGLDHSAPQAG
uniref:Uncharacterized protein n=1 Tax=Cacopsylla melanoneura TaxID=428564 RepID=A0A8D8RBI0_9HEMI